MLSKGASNGSQKKVTYKVALNCHKKVLNKTDTKMLTNIADFEDMCRMIFPLVTGNLKFSSKPKPFLFEKFKKFIYKEMPKMFV